VKPSLTRRGLRLVMGIMSDAADVWLFRSRRVMGTRILSARFNTAVALATLTAWCSGAAFGLGALSSAAFAVLPVLVTILAYRVLTASARWRSRAAGIAYAGAAALVPLIAASAFFPAGRPSHLLVTAWGTAALTILARRGVEPA